MPQEWTLFNNVFKKPSLSKQQQVKQQQVGNHIDKEKSTKSYSKLIYKENSKFQELRDSIKFKEEEDPLYQNAKRADVSLNKPKDSFEFLSSTQGRVNQFIN